MHATVGIHLGEALHNYCASIRIIAGFVQYKQNLTEQDNCSSELCHINNTLMMSVSISSQSKYDKSPECKTQA